MTKKWIKICAAICLIVVILFVAAFFALKQMYPPSRLKMMAQEYVSQKLQREFTFDSISFTWIGFTLTQAALSEEHTFEQGTFIKANKLTARVAIGPLLHKQIKIRTIEADGLQVNLVAQKDGSFNFDTLLSTQENPAAETSADTTKSEEESSSSSFVITAKKIRLKNCDLIYRDEQTGMRTALNKLNIKINNFNTNAPFDSTIEFTTHISTKGQPTISLPASIQAKIFLAGFNLPKAQATISQATASYKTAKLNLQGAIKNFEQPNVDLTGSLTGINSAVLNELAPELPNFALPTIHLALKADVNFDTQTATISQAKLSAQDSTFLTQGTFSWNEPTPTYDLSGSLKAIVNQLVQMTDTLDGFSPTGTIQASFKATEKNDYTDVRGNILLQDLSVLYKPFTITKLNGNILLASLNDMSSPALTGKLNGESFRGSFSYKAHPTATDIILNLNLDKLILTKFSSTQDNANNQTETSSSQPENTTTDTTSPMNLQAKVVVGEIVVPYFQSNGMTLTADLTNLTDSMAHTNGTIDFAFQPGKITNLDDFIKDSKTAKILLLPISIIKKVAGFLRIDLFPSKDKTQGTTISFTEGAGTYTFTDGVMNIDKTVFNSTVTNITAQGTANFQTNALDMKAKATLLTQAAPIAFKITGTLNDPKGKLDIVNTVTSIVGGVLNGTALKSTASGTISLTKGTANTAAKAAKGTANTAAKAAKGTVSTAADVAKEIGSLFKKKKDE